MVGDKEGREGGRGKDEKTYSHTQNTRSIMFPRKILIRERFRTINRRTPCPISIQEISSLNHEIFNLKCTVAYIYSLLALYRGKEKGKSGG